MEREQIMKELFISESDTKEATREKLLLAAILHQGVEIAGSILKRYKELADIVKV